MVHGVLSCYRLLLTMLQYLLGFGKKVNAVIMWLLILYIQSLLVVTLVVSRLVEGAFLGYRAVPLRVCTKVWVVLQTVTMVGTLALRAPSTTMW